MSTLVAPHLEFLETTCRTDTLKYCNKSTGRRGSNGTLSTAMQYLRNTTRIKELQFFAWLDALLFCQRNDTVLPCVEVQNVQKVTIEHEIMFRTFYRLIKRI